MYLFRYWLDLSQEDIHWNLSDTGWAKTAWSNLFAPWTQGACVFVHHTPKFDAVKTLQVQFYVYTLVNFMYDESCLITYVVTYPSIFVSECENHSTF